jgi:dolichol-phosphate mannosyltransferase
MINSLDYSIVIPIFNEEDTILELWKQLNEVLHQITGSKEVIFTNDGSQDSSLDLLLKLRSEFPEIKIINFSRNFGHQSALSAGLDYANGKAIILMDGDLQDSPRTILKFVEKWKEGYDVVYSIRTKRKENLLKRLAFKTFYRVQKFLSEVEIPLDAGIFSLLDRKVVLAIRSMPERNRYLSGLRAYSGFKQVGITVERGARFSGEPRVSLRKLFRLAFDGIFAFSTVPLKIATYLGITVSFFSLLIALVGLLSKFVFGVRLLGWDYGLTSTFFLGGVQLVFLGILGEYIARIYEEVKHRPNYVIREMIGFDNASGNKLIGY